MSMLRARFTAAGFLPFCLAALLLVSGGRAEAASAEDVYLAGYASAVLEREFNMKAGSVQVENGTIIVKAASPDPTAREKISNILSSLPGVRQVLFQGTPERTSPAPPLTIKPEEVVAAVEPQERIVLPQGKLFEPLIADPRWAHFSVSYHYYNGDQELEHVGSTSFGESLGLYRDRAFFGGQWQLDLQAAVFAIFDLDSDSFDLINADYWVGFPVAYRNGRFSALFRLFHQSSHLGDEYLLRSRIDRVNLSYESVDAKFSYRFVQWLRLYGGAGFIFHKEPGDLEPWSTQFGLEITSPRTLAGGLLRPLAAADFQGWEERDWDYSVSVRTGIQVENPEQLRRRLLLLLEYFNGHSPNGQFFDRTIEYLGLGAHFFF